MVFARRLFTFAGAYGLLALLPMYFLEERIGRDTPPPITHPEYFYGFLGVGVAWQVVFLIIGRDPARFRPLILPAVLEKVSFGLPVIALYFAGRLSAPALCFGVIDLVLGLLFVVAFVRTAPHDRPKT
jgi:hypothetical protein